MKKMGMTLMGMMLAFNMFSGVAYADDTSDNLKKASDILDILADDEDHKDKEHPGNSKNARDNHGQNKKK